MHLFCTRAAHQDADVLLVAKNALQTALPQRGFSLWMWLLVPMSGMRGRLMHFRLYTALDRMAKDKAGDSTRIAYLHGSLITRQTPSSP